MYSLAQEGSRHLQMRVIAFLILGVVVVAIMSPVREERRLRLEARMAAEITMIIHLPRTLQETL